MNFLKRILTKTKQNIHYTLFISSLGRRKNLLLVFVTFIVIRALQRQKKLLPYSRHNNSLKDEQI